MDDSTIYVFGGFNEGQILEFATYILRSVKFFYYFKVIVLVWAPVIMKDLLVKLKWNVEKPQDKADSITITEHVIDHSLHSEE